MKLKKFLEYTDLYSKDPKTFEKRVIFASPEKYAIAAFEEVELAEHLLSYPERPIVLWNGMSLRPMQVNESRNHIFNLRGLPSFRQVEQELEGADFLPKSTRDRAKVKDLKFPIVGHSGEQKVDLKTYGKFKKSEHNFERFSEKPTPITRFDALAFRKNPIHLQERINLLGFDVDPRRFIHMHQIEETLEQIEKKYSPDFYQATFIDAGDRLYLESLSTSAKLSPSQLVRMYETAYSSHYETQLPAWFKNRLFEDYVKPYYAKRYLDAAMLKPKHAIDFKKYSN